MPELNISIEESGEDLYITPVAYDYKSNKVIYYRCHEFNPYPNPFDDIFCIKSGIISWNLGLLFRSPYHLVKWTISDIRRIIKARFFKFYHFYIRKFGAVCCEIWQQPCFWRNLKHFGIFWDSLYPIQAVELFNGEFWVNSQLSVKDENGYSDSHYLIPSQKYLEARVNEWIEEYPKVKENLEEYQKTRGRNVYCYQPEEKIAEFKAWRQKMLDKGCEIGYIAELET